MSSYTIEWVGADPHEYQGINSWAIAGVDEDGNKFKKTKLELPASVGSPSVGDVIEGALEAHPRMDGVKLLTENGDIPPGTAESASNAPPAPSGGSATYDSIEARSALHAAIESGAKTPEEARPLAEGYHRLIQDLKAGPTEQPPLDTAESVQADAKPDDPPPF